MSSLALCFVLVASVSSYPFLKVKINYPFSSVQDAGPDVAVFTFSSSAICYNSNQATRTQQCKTPWGSQNPSYYVTMAHNIPAGGNIWTYEIDLGNSSVATPITAYPYTVYTQIFGGAFSIPTCLNKQNTTQLYETHANDGNCLMNGMPYQTNITSSTAIMTLNTYPTFGISSIKEVTEATTVVIPNYFSSFFNNKRNVSVFVPYSMKENSVGRPINILVMNDGALNYLSSAINRGGLDSAMQNGALPEVLIIGIAQPANNTQRVWELTPWPCVPSLNMVKPAVCSGYPLTGGADAYLSMVQTIITQVMAQFKGFSINERSMFGYSLGGLTACYAAATNPSYWHRAYCGSPTTWYNSGQLAATVSSANAKNNGVKPKAIVLSLGTLEGAVGYNSPTAPNTYVTWTQYTVLLQLAWESIGLVVGKHIYGITLIGGAHTVTSWENILIPALEGLYTNEFPMSNITQRYNMMQPLIQPIYAPDASSAASSQLYSQASVICLGFFLTIFMISTIVLSFLVCRSGNGCNFSSNGDSKNQHLLNSNL